jgi:hypothetical protein
MAKKITHGGRRTKSGRKPVEDPKVQVSLYIHKSWIDKIGLDALRDDLYVHAEKLFNKKN